MRKITSFVAMCLLLMVSMTVKAQSVSTYGDPLITDASQLYDNEYGDSQEGTDLSALIDMNNGTFWHTDWHGASHPDGTHHWLFVQFDEPVTGRLAIWMNRRSTSNDHPVKMLVEGSNDAPGENNEEGKGAAANQKWTSITEVDLPFDGSGTPTECLPFTIEGNGYKYLRFAPSDCLPADPGFRTFWHTAEFQLYAINDEDARLIAALNSMLDRYDAYCRKSQGDYVQKLNMGEGFGQYTNTEAEATFLDDLDKVYDILDGNLEMPSGDEIDALVKEIEDAYAAILASEVPFSLKKNGYYRIIGTMQYYHNVKVGTSEEEGDIYEKQDYHDIAMLSQLEGYAAWDKKDNTDPRQIWKLEQQEGGIKMINAATDMQISEMGSPVKMTTEADTLMAFDWVGNENDRDVLVIRLASATKFAGGVYLHQWEHHKGAGHGDEGVGYQLCAWNNTFNMGDMYDSDKGTSEWYLEEVPAEEAEALIKAYEPIKNHDVLVLNYENLINKANAAVAISKEEASTKLIKENSQFQSWCTESSEGSINNLLDTDPGTFWHSAWSGGSVENHVHGFDVKFPDGLQPGSYKVWVQRRGTNGNDDNVIAFSVYGTNNDDLMDAESETYGLDEGWTKIADLTLPWSSSVSEQFAEEPLVTEADYKYLRFYNEGTSGPNEGNKNRGYFHMGGFQIYQITGAQQLASMGKVGEDMLAALETAAGVDRATMTINDYNALEAAYNAFMDKLVDPTELRSTIAANANACADFIEGADPGRYPNADLKNKIASLIEAAEAYDNKGAYTKEECAKYVEDIKAAVEEYKASRNTITTGKWYKFRHMNDEEGEMFPGIKGAGAAAIFGQYIGVGHQEETNNAETNTLHMTEDMAMGDNLFFFSAEAAEENEDAIMFRFVQVTDSTYAVQNKASGLYISRCQENDTYGITMGATPAPIMVKSIGYGQNLLIMHTTEGVKYDKPNLNCWAGNGNLVAYWNDTVPGCNSTYMIEESGDVEGDVESEFNVEVEVNKIQAMCYSVSLKDVDAAGEMYSIAGTFTEGEKNYVGLKSIEQSEAGVPFVYFVGDYEAYNAEEKETTIVKFAAGSDIVLNPVNEGPARGTNVYQWINPGYVVFYEGKVVFSEGEDNTDCSRDVNAHSGYVSWNNTTVAKADCDLVLEIDGTIETGIQNAIANVAKNGNVYNMAGQIVRSNANINSLKGLSKGIYMLNGTKVLVK